MADHSSTPNLNTLDDKSLEKWISSFDHVLLDCDGVVLSGINLIPGAKEGISAFKAIGKSVHIITNNSTRNTSDWQKTFDQYELELSGEDVIHPTKVAIDYLKEKNVEGEIFVLGYSKMKQQFTDAGFTLFEYSENKCDELWSALDALKQEDVSKVSAVIIDFDIEMTYLKLMMAYIIAKRPEVHLIFAAVDKCIKYGDIWIIGPHYFQVPLQILTEKKPIKVGKPSVLFKDYLQKEYDIDPKRTLFIGDSLETDMLFANQCSFLKMLVLTGVTNKEQMAKCKDSLKPRWYLDNLGVLEKLLKK